MMRCTRTINVSIDKMIEKENQLVDSMMFGYIQRIAIGTNIDINIVMNEDAIQEALEKQMPYKPKTSIYCKHVRKCKCGEVFLKGATNYCGKCGQKLDWSDADGKSD